MNIIQPAGLPIPGALSRWDSEHGRKRHGHQRAGGVNAGPVK